MPSITTIIPVVAAAVCLTPTITLAGPACPADPLSVPTWLYGTFLRYFTTPTTGPNDGLPVYNRTGWAVQLPNRVRASLGVPSSVPHFTGAKSFDDLSLDELKHMYTLDGGLGNITVNCSHAINRGDDLVWYPYSFTPRLQYQPVPDMPSTGQLIRGPQSPAPKIDLTSVIRDAHSGPEITDGWWKLSDGVDSFFHAWIEKKTDAGGYRLSEALVMAGDMFIYFRNRNVDLPPASNMTDLISATKGITRETIVAYLDMEISVGSVGAGHFIIDQSTLPWQRGKTMPLKKRISVSPVDGRVTPVAWEGENWYFPVDTLYSKSLVAMFDM